MEIKTPSFVFAKTTYYSDRITPGLNGIPLDVQKTPSGKTGIKVYGCVLGWLLSKLGIAVRLKDALHRTYFVNKNSLIGWTQNNGASLTNTWRQLEQFLHKIIKDRQMKDVLDVLVDNKDPCAVCFEGKKFIKLSCSHAQTCISCLKQIVIQAERERKDPICPIDRGNLSLKDIKAIKESQVS